MTEDLILGGLKRLTAVDFLEEVERTNPNIPIQRVNGDIWICFSNGINRLGPDMNKMSATQYTAFIRDFEMIMAERREEQLKKKEDVTIRFTLIQNNIMNNLVLRCERCGVTCYTKDMSMHAFTKHEATHVTISTSEELTQ